MAQLFDLCLIILFLRITIFIYTALFKTQSYDVFEKDKIKSTHKVYTILKSCKHNNISILSILFWSYVSVAFTVVGAK